jgi:3'-5' exoribonuclease
MKNQYISALQDGDTVNDYFVATRKDLRDKRDGGKFLGMVFKDKTGEMGGVMWKGAQETSALFEVGDVVNVRARVATYQERLQMQVEQVLPLRDADFNIDDLIDRGGGSSDDINQLKSILDTITNEYLKKLIELYFADEEFVFEFKNAVAAKKWHHEYQGGLVRHVYEMARIALTMCELYPNINRDLLLTGVFLHDLGKLDEMTHGLFTEYTRDGRLLGHLQIGCTLLIEKTNQIPDFPDTLRSELLHFILSHHGEPGFGSPVRPMTLEAIVLHHIDNLDAQAAAITRIVRDCQEQNKEWSDYLPLIERVIYARRA